MPRDVDERKTRKALRKLRAAKARAEAGTGPELSDWEEDFLNSLEARLEQYGSAFNDPEKGDREEPLSMLQAMKVKEIDKKTRGKEPRGFSQGRGFSRRARPEREGTETCETGAGDTAPGDSDTQPAPEARRAAFRVISGNG
jgi:hypothetical protein